MVLLQVTQINKNFSGTHALRDVSLELLSGEVHALMGENGTGKSTLMHIISGVYRPDAGSISIEGMLITLTTPRRAQELGIGMVFQDLSLVPGLSIAENIFPNRAPSRVGLVAWRRLYARTSELLRALVGVVRIHQGSILLDGKPLHVRSPEHAFAQGIAYLAGRTQKRRLVPENVAAPEHLSENTFQQKCETVILQEAHLHRTMEMDKAVSQKGDRYNIRVLDRAVSVLSMLSDGKPRTLMELSDAIGINSSTTFRLLASLTSHNYVERDPETGRYSLGLACLELARSYQINNAIRRAALPLMETLRDQTGETVHLAVLDRQEIVYLEKLHGLHAIGLMASQVGGRALAYCTGLGKLLLAYVDPERVRTQFEDFQFIRFTETTVDNLDRLMAELDVIRRKGYAFDHGEHESDVRCVAAPVYDSHGRVVAAISLAGPASRMEPLDNPRQIELVVRSAQEISERLGYRPNLSRKP